MENAIYALIPIFALAIPVSAIVFSNLLKLQRLRLEEAKLRLGDPEEMDRMAQQIAALQQELSEVQERLDFAERLLAQGRNPPALPEIPTPR